MAIFFAFYAIVIYHFRRVSILSNKPSTTYDDKFGPYVIVLLFVAATIFSSVVPLWHPDTIITDYNNAYYPFYPALLPDIPNVVILSAPLPLEDVFNRTIWISTTLDYLISLSINSHKFYFDKASNNERLYQITHYKTPQQNISTYFSLLKNVYDDAESETIFDLYSTLPQFGYIPPPQVSQDGKDTYQLYMSCKGSKFYHRSMVYNMPFVNSFGELANYINYVLEDLKVSPQLNLTNDTSVPYKSVYKWSADAEIDTVVSLISITLYYSSLSPEEDEKPIDASFDIHFENTDVMRGTIYARSLLSQLIYDNFKLWPDEW